MQRRLVRAHLIGAPLFVAQIGTDRIQRLLNSGDPTELELVRLSDKATVEEVLDVLARAPPLMVLELLDKKRSDAIQGSLSRVADDLDFTQTVAGLVSRSGKLNAVKNALVGAFRKRNSHGRFQQGNSMSLDTLIYENAAKEVDEDQPVVEETPKKGRRSIRQLYCFDYQGGRCKRTSCRFPHRCSKCWDWSHGANNCNRKAEKGYRKTRRGRSRSSIRQRNVTPESTLAPPNPRSRRDRPRTGS